MAGETSGGDPARRPRGLGFEAEGGMAGPGGSGWEEAVGEGKGRAVTSGRASEQAGGGHIDIDPLPRYEMAHWAAMAAASLRRRERARDWKEARVGGPAENATNGLESCGLVLSLKLLPARF